MFNYPLTITSGALGLNPKVVVVDPDKKVALFIKAKAGPVRDGKEPYKIYADEKQTQLLSQIMLNKVDKKTKLFEISTADGTKLGTVVPDGNRKWAIQSSSGIKVGSMIEKNGWRRDMYLLVGSLVSQLFLIFAPIKLEFELNGQNVLELKEKFDLLNNVFTLSKCQDCSTGDEQLLLASLMVYFWPV